MSAPAIRSLARRRSLTRRIRRSTDPPRASHAGVDPQQELYHSLQQSSQPSLIESMMASAARPATMVLEMLGKHDLLALRATSRTMKTWVEIDPSRYHVRVFKNLYYHGRVNDRQHLRQSLDALATIAPYCRQLRIYLYNKRIVFDPPHLSLEGTEDTFWMHAFSMISTTIRNLSISAPGRNVWDYVAYESIERQVVSIRVAMEQKFSRGLDALHLDPISPGALLNLRWRGLPVGRASSEAEIFWSNLMWLKIKLFNPLAFLSYTSKFDFLKTLHDFLGSFRRSLHGLEFEWIGPQGPSPLMLDLVTDFEGLLRAEPFQWSGLKYARLINTDAVDPTEFEVVAHTRAKHFKKLIIVNKTSRRSLPPSSRYSSLESFSPFSNVERLDDRVDDTDELMFKMEDL